MTHLNTETYDNLLKLRWQNGALLDQNGYANRLIEFYQEHRHQGEFAGVDGFMIRYDVFRHPSPQCAVVLSHGTGESSARYMELVKNLLDSELSCSVYILNHRGQGFSQRLLGHRDWQSHWDVDQKSPELEVYRKTHVENFDHYVADFHSFMERVVAPDGVKPMYAIGHSMGGAILARFTEVHPQWFDGIVLTAPMLDIKWPVPQFLIAVSARIANRLNPTGYAIGQSNYNFFTMPFQGNPLTSCESRYCLRQFIDQTFPPVILGGKTWGWVYQALKIMPRIRRDADKIQCPVLMIGAEQEHLVLPSGHEKFWSRLQSSPRDHSKDRKIILRGARHEFFMEQDSIRNWALKEIFQFFTELS